MEEKILVKSKPVAFAKPLFIGIAVLILLTFLIQFLSPYIQYTTCDVYGGARDWSDCGDIPHSRWNEESGRYWDKCDAHEKYETGADFAMAKFKKSLPTTCIISAGLIFISVLLFAWLRNIEITVTNKRVYGRAAFGKRVDLPMDSIAAFGTMWPKGISVSSSSGRIGFLMLQNRDEIYKCVSDLMIERQSKTNAAPVTAIRQEAPLSNAEELKKYKELLDMGAITQEEFDAKKKQLLGL